MSEHQTPAGHLERLVASPLAPAVIPVIPPIARLTPGLSILPQSRGKVPGFFRNGFWRGIPDWVNVPAPTPAQARFQDKAGANAGLRGGDLVVGLDLDITDAAILDRVVDLIVNHFGGRPPVRSVSREGHIKILMAVRVVDIIFGNPAPPKSRDIVFKAPDGISHKIQILAKGRQFVAAGGHAFGGDYQWDRDIADVGPLEVTDDEFAAFMEALFRLLAELGFSLKAGTGQGEETDGDRTRFSAEEAKVAAELDMKKVRSMRGKAMDDLPEDLRGRFEDALEQVGSLGELWLDGGTGDGSVNVILLANHMHGLGFGVTEFGMVLQTWAHAAGEKGIHRKDGGGNGDKRSIVRAWTKAVMNQAPGDFPEGEIPDDDSGEEAGEEIGADDDGSKEKEAKEEKEEKGADGKGRLPPHDFWTPVLPPNLPPGLLPRSIESFAVSMATTTGADATGFAMAAVVACAAVITDDIRLQVLRNSTDWMEAARIWVALIGDPSVKKTPIIKGATKPVSDIDLELFRQYSMLKQFHDADIKAGKKSEPPVHRRLMLNDTTADAAQDILKGSPDGVLLAQDELSGFFSSMERYSPGKGDRSFWLRTYNGGPYQVSRVNRGTFVIPNLSVCMLGGAQPDIARLIAGNTADDGLIQRITPIILRRGGATRDVGPSPEAAGYDSLIRRLHQRRPPAGASGKPGPLMLDAGGMAVRAELEEEHLQISRALEQAGARKLSAAIIKQDGLFARLCIGWHAVETIDLPALPLTIGSDVAHRVASFMRRFLRPHLFAFYEATLGASDDQDRLAAIAGHILTHRLDIVANREAQAGLNSLHKITSKDLTLLFEQLESLGWVTRVTPARANASPRWKVVPEVHGLFAAQAEAEKQRQQELAEMLRKMRSAGATDGSTDEDTQQQV